MNELLQHKFLDVDLPYELRVTEAALTEFIRREHVQLDLICTATGLFDVAYTTGGFVWVF